MGASNYPITSELVAVQSSCCHVGPLFEYIWMCGNMCLHVSLLRGALLVSSQKTKNVLICLSTLSSPLFVLASPTSSVWILDMSDWRTQCILYFGLSQTRAAEINRKIQFPSLLLGRPSSVLLNIVIWRRLSFTKTSLRHISVFSTSPEGIVLCSHSCLKHPVTKTGQTFSTCHYFSVFVVVFFLQ